MNNMLSQCSTLKELNLNSFKTDKLDDTYHMFERCTSLIELNWDNLNANKITYIANMFWECPDDFIKKIKKKFKNLNPAAFREY